MLFCSYSTLYLLFIIIFYLKRKLHTKNLAFSFILSLLYYGGDVIFGCVFFADNREGRSAASAKYPQLECTRKAWISVCKDREGKRRGLSGKVESVYTG